MSLWNKNNENAENEEGTQTLEQKLHALNDEQLKELAPRWKEIYEADRNNKENAHAYALLKRECARRGIRV